MSDKVNYTEEEWELLRTAPMLVGAGVVAAEPSGLIAGMKEATAISKAMMAGLKAHTDMPLFASIGSDKERVDTSSVKTKGTSMERVEKQKEKGLDAARDAMALLDAKGDEGEVEAYRAWLMDVATKTAEAGKERGTGEMVSQHEKDYLAALEAAMSEA